VISESFVVDTNLVFSALIPRESRIRDLILDRSYSIYAPNFLITEVYKHKEKLLRNSRLNDDEFFEYFSGVSERIQFIPLEFISLENRQKAYDVCKDIDMKDIPFVALTFELGIKIWTGDKKLKEGLKARGVDIFFEPKFYG